MDSTVDNEKREFVEDCKTADMQKVEEDVVDNWEDFINELSDEEKKKNENKTDNLNQSKTEKKEKEVLGGKKAKNKKKNFKQKNAENCRFEENNFLQKTDKYAEKLKAEKLVMNSDAMLAEDLFEGCERPEGYEPAAYNKINSIEKKNDQTSKSNFFENSNLNYLKEVEIFAEYFIHSIIKSNAKSCAWFRLLEIILRDTSPKMIVKDLSTLANKISSFIQHKRNVTVKKPDNHDNSESYFIISLENLKEVETFAEKLATKIRSSKGKSVVWLRLFDIILPYVVPKMDAKDLSSFFKNIENCIQLKCVSKTESYESKRKPNSAGCTVKNYKDEIDLLYGDISDDDEDYEDNKDLHFSNNEFENDDDSKTLESDSGFMSPNEK